MSIGDGAGGAADAIAQMNISKANLVVTTSWLEYDMFPHGWLPDFNSSYGKSKMPWYNRGPNTVRIAADIWRNQ
jgi:hypothetical protein